MLTSRIIGAFKLQKNVFAEVEKDTSFTSIAWLIVIVVSFLSRLGASARLLQDSAANWFLASVLGTIGAVIAFGVAVMIINWIGRRVYKVSVTSDELVRTLGLAYVWNIIAFFGIIAGLVPALLCLVAPALIAGTFLGLVAMFLAAREALDLEWFETLVTLVLGWIALIAIGVLVDWLLGALGLGPVGFVSILPQA